jgi:hypothetical protein
MIQQIKYNPKQKLLLFSNTVSYHDVRFKLLNYFLIESHQKARFNVLIGDLGNGFLNTSLNLLRVLLDAVDGRQVLLHLVVHLGHDAGEDHVEGALPRAVLTRELPSAVRKLAISGIAERVGGDFHNV